MESGIRILLLEDSESDAELIRFELSRVQIAFTLVLSDNAADFTKNIDEFKPKIILSDYSLPRFDAVMAFKIAKEKCPDIPFIIVSGKMGEEFAIEAMRMGVSDYVLKDRLQRLVPAVMRALGEAESRAMYLQARKDVIESETKFRILMDHANDAIIIFDENGNIIETNKKAEEILRYNKEEFIQLNVTGLFSLDAVSSIHNYIKQVLGSGSGFINDKEMIKKNGDILPCDISSSIVLIGGKKLIQAIVRDISDRKKVELRIEKYQEDLKLLTSELLKVEERERRSIATDLHDVLVQNLAILKIKLDMMKKNFPNDYQSGLINESYELIDQTIQFARTLITELSPPILYELGLEPAIEWLSESFQGKYKLSVKFEDDREKKTISEEISIMIFKAIRELLINIVKHAGATHVLISISQVFNNMEIIVADDGVGFNAEDIDSYGGAVKGFGLFNIKERLIFIGGDIEIVSSLGKGTAVTLSIPLKTT